MTQFKNVFLILTNNVLSVRKDKGKKIMIETNILNEDEGKKAKI